MPDLSHFVIELGAKYMNQSKKNNRVKNPPPKKGAWSKRIKHDMKRIHKLPTIKRGR